MTWVWATTHGPRGPSLIDPLQPSRVAFIDGGDEPVTWGRSYPAGPDAARQAAAELAATAVACVAAAGPPGGGSIEVSGRGMLAEIVRRLLPGGSAGIHTEPRAEAEVVIETAGNAARIAKIAATRPRLGRLVLAVPPRSADVELATYSDVHVRGLALVGVPWAPSVEASSEAIGDAARRLGAALWFTGPVD